jgi:hypothetical protein
MTSTNSGSRVGGYRRYLSPQTLSSPFGPRAGIRHTATVLRTLSGRKRSSTASESRRSCCPTSLQDIPICFSRKMSLGMWRLIKKHRSESRREAKLPIVSCGCGVSFERDFGEDV